MKKITGKSLLSLVLIKSAIVAAWYVYGKYLAKDASSSESLKTPVGKPNEKPSPKEQFSEVKKETFAKPEVKSTTSPAKKVAVKVVKKTPVKPLPLVKADKVVVEKVKKAPVKKKTKAV